MVSPVGAVLAGLLWLVELLLLARIAADWAAVLATGRAAGRWLTRPIAVVHRLSEPLLAPLHRVLPRPRLGSVRLDLASAVLLILVMIVRGWVVRL